MAADCPRLAQPVPTLLRAALLLGEQVALPTILAAGAVIGTVALGRRVK